MEPLVKVSKVVMNSICQKTITRPVRLESKEEGAEGQMGQEGKGSGTCGSL